MQGAKVQVYKYTSKRGKAAVGMLWLVPKYGFLYFGSA